jgi:hypothetical protein
VNALSRSARLVLRRYGLSGMPALESREESTNGATETTIDSGLCQEPRSVNGL